MDFDLEKDFPVFDELLKKRPEIIPEKLKDDLKTYYLPYLKKLVELKKKTDTSKAIIVGVSAIQGTGKTTQGEILEILLTRLGYSSVSRSIDDHYITHKELCQLRTKDPRYIRRGVTHDISLAILDLRDLQQMNEEEVILASGYDKGANSGDGERFRWVNLQKDMVIKAVLVEQEVMVNKESETVLTLKMLSLDYQGNEVPLPNRMGAELPVLEGFLNKGLIEFLNTQKEETLIISESDSTNLKFEGTTEFITEKKGMPNGWRLITKKPDFVFYDGWMLGARMVEDESIFDSGLPALETVESKEFARLINKKLENYEPLWEMIDFLNCLYVTNFQKSLEWRDQAEDALRSQGKGMSHDQIREFVYYFWRSVHPGIHIKNLAHDNIHTNQVVIINDDHTVKEILSPEEVKEKYP